MIQKNALFPATVLVVRVCRGFVTRVPAKKLTCIAVGKRETRGSGAEGRGGGGGSEERRTETREMENVSFSFFFHFLFFPFFFLSPTGS